LVTRLLDDLSCASSVNSIQIGIKARVKPHAIICEMVILENKNKRGQNTPKYKLGMLETNIPRFTKIITSSLTPGSMYTA